MKLSILLIMIIFFESLKCKTAKPIIPITSWDLSSSAAYGKSAFKVTVPSTVISGLLESKVIDFNPFYGKNLDMIKDSLFEVPWVYETSVDIENIVDEEVILLCFDGLNFKADVWVNEVQVGFNKDLVGPFRHFKLDVTNAVKKGQLYFADDIGGSSLLNTKAQIRVEINRANDFTFPWDNNSTDLAITFVDWNPHPPDFSMGLFRPVYLQRLEGKSTYPLTLEGPVVDTKLESDLKSATLTVSYVIENWQSSTIQKQTFYADLGIPGVDVLEKVVDEIKSGEEVRVVFDAVKIDIAKPEDMLWWPWQMGKQNMFHLKSGIISSNNNNMELHASKYGIREVKSKLSKYDFLEHYINGKELSLVRAAGWTPDMFFRSSYDLLRNQFMLIRDMNLNTIRLEGKMEEEDFWDLADEFGILMIPGWCCCDAWQHWPFWDGEDYTVARESLRTQVRRLSIHPSLLSFMYSSDELPPPDVEKMYLGVFEEEKWPNPTIASGSEYNSSVTGPTGVKMSGPYSWVPPVYWLEDKSYTHNLGGAFGFITEGGPGEAPLTLRSWNRTVPEDHIWEESEGGSMSSWWSYHCANPEGLFYDLRFFTPPLNARYGPGKSGADYLYKAQAMSYEGMRAFYESYARNRHRNATGLVQWMLNNAWPSHWWHLYDAYLSSGGGYYATKKANEPLHAMMSYTDGSVWLMNQVFSPIESVVTVRADIMSMDGDIVWSKAANVSRLEEDASVAVEGLVVPIHDAVGDGKFGVNDTFFVQLEWGKLDEDVLQRNTYWMSPTMDILDWKDTQYYRTGCSQFANFQKLQTLPNVQLKVVVDYKSEENLVSVKIENPRTSGAVAFFIEVVAMDARKNNPGVDITPVFWTDNYFTLKPGDSKVVETILPADVKSEDDVNIVVQSWNDIVGGH